MIKATVNFRGHGIRWSIYEPSEEFIDKIQVYSARRKQDFELTVFDLEFYEYLKIKGVNYYTNLPFTKTYHGLNPNKMGLIEFKLDNRIISRVKASDFTQALLFPIYDIKQITLNTLEYLNAIYFREETIGTIKQLKTIIQKKEDLTNLYFTSVRNESMLEPQFTINSVGLENNTFTEKEGDYLISSSCILTNDY